MIKAIIGSVFAVLAIGFIILGFNYSQEFRQDSNTTATKGILLKQELNLVHYKNVSSGLGLYGNYSRYSRSDRHDDVITVWCNDYCRDK